MLLAISGALRAGSTNTKLVTEAARLYGGPWELADLRLPLYDGDLEKAEGIPQSVMTLHDQIARAEAVAISCPEYNKALTGVMKNALDWVSRVKGNPWKGKPVAIMAAAAGREGGARSNFSLRLAMNAFRPRLLTGPEMHLADSSNQFDENGRLISERYEATLSELMTALRDEVALVRAYEKSA